MHPWIIITLCVIGYVSVPGLAFLLPPFIPTLNKWVEKGEQESPLWFLLWIWPITLCGLAFIAVIAPIIICFEELGEWRNKKIAAMKEHIRIAESVRWNQEHAEEIKAEEDRRNREAHAMRYL